MIKKITTLFFTGALCLISYLSMTNPGGPGASYTNAPNENNCTSCHSGSLITSGSNWNNITMTSNFTGGGYIPDSTYTIKVSFSQSGISKWGFQATFLDAGNKMAGTLTGSGRVSIVRSSSLSRDYVGQNSTGTSSTGTNSTDWTFTWKAPKVNSGNIRVFMSVMAADGGNSNSNDIVYAKVFTISPSSLLPVADAKSKDSATCATSSVNLEGTSTNNATSWSWALQGATPNSSTAQNPVVKYNNVGTYWAVLTSKNAKGTSKADSLKITVKSRPTLNISGPTAYTLCKGDSVKLTATINANYAYTWSPGGFVTNPIWAKDTGNYFVSIKDNSNCVATAGPIKIAHHPSHTVSISRSVNNDTICFERPIQITAIGTTTFDSFLYYDVNGYLLTTTNNPYDLKLSGSNKLRIKAKDSKGCFTPMSNEFNFVVKNELLAPSANCSNKSTGGFQIDWSSVTGALGYEVSLDSGKTWESPSSGSTGLSHKVFGFPSNTDVQILLRAIDLFPCYNSPVTRIVCGSIPCSPLTYDVAWTKDVCKGDQMNFRIKNLKTNAYSFKVDNGNPFKDTVFQITADFSRTYKFELTDSVNLSCPTIKRDAEVVVWEIPFLNLSSNNSQNIFCEGFPALFNAEAKGMQEYNFFLNNSSVKKSSISTWTYAQPKNLDSVWVEVTNGACKSTSGKIILGVKPLPTASFVYSFSGKKASFNASETGKAKFLWTFGDGTSDTLSKNPTHDYTSSGLTSAWVKLTVTDEFGCVSIDSVEVSIPLSISDNLRANGVKIYPQPATNVLNIEIPGDLLLSTIQLSDATGRVLGSLKASKTINEIGVAELPQGIYFLNISKGERQLNSRIIIIK